MAAANGYDPDYIASCRARDESQVAMFHEVVTAARSRDVDGGTDLESALDSLESEYFNNLLIVLDSYFGQRDPHLDAGVGNPLGEVRRLVDSLVQGGGSVLPDAEGAPDPQRTVLGLRAGDPVQLTAYQYQRLSNAVFAQLERHGQ